MKSFFGTCFSRPALGLPDDPWFLRLLLVGCVVSIRPLVLLLYALLYDNNQERCLYHILGHNFLNIVKRQLCSVISCECLYSARYHSVCPLFKIISVEYP